MPPSFATPRCTSSRTRRRASRRWSASCPGPDLPTGGIIVEDKASILEAYKTGRGSFRVRARWKIEDQGRGTYAVIVTEIPYQVQKARLIEKIAELMEAKKLPLLADVRDESAEDVRLVLEPKSRTVDPALLMESLFKLTDLETRIPLNMNVLSRGVVPKVMGLGEVLNEWLAHRREVLVRRSEHRLEQIDHRLEVLDGYLIAYLNLDEVIKIIRTEDEPKPVLMKTFKLTDVQAEAILNMRLRSLRKLEEFEIRGEHDTLSKEQKSLNALMKSEDKQWAAIADEIKAVRKTFGPEHAARQAPHDLRRGARARRRGNPDRHGRARADHRRRLREGLDPRAEGPRRQGDLAFKTDDKLKAAIDAETTDKIIVASTGGRFYTLAADKLPGGRGHGEPIKLMVDMDAAEDVVAGLRPRSGAEAPGRLDRGPRLRRAGGRGARQYAQGQAGDVGRRRRGDAPLRRRPPATPSPCSARTASSSSSRSTRCRRWRAARASACRNTRTAASPTRASSRRPTG